MARSFSRLRELFERCIDVPEGERPQWFEHNVPDTGERIELELMLAADCHASGFFGSDLAERIDFLGAQAGDDGFAPIDQIGRRYGAFELRRKIGRGGQGTVYLAERRDGDFAQTVAVKILHRGIHDADDHRRFRREREILARFEHPGVARLVDGGVSREGVPYLAMEFVDGEPIDRWCAQHQLSVDARLRLFADLCDIVAAAQRALIVHRDLKPSNVLVNTDGNVKVLDFGIARLLDEDQAGGQTRQPMLTPGYGAPEQVIGGAVTLATDVYALGVLMRVLLTGEAPAEDLLSRPARLPTGLSAELQWILTKACAAEPEMRYGDAAALARDVVCHLERRPVMAHPPSRTYQLRKFAQRHRGGIVVTLALIAGLVASLVLSLWQASIAREQARRAEATRDFLLGVFESASEDLPADARPTPDVLARAAATRLQGDTTLAPSTHAEFLTTLGDVAKNGNDYAGALDFHDQALRVLEASGLRDSRAHLAIEVKRAWILGALNRTDAAVEALRPRLAVLREAGDAITVDGLWAYADAREAAGQPDEALILIGEARDLSLAVNGADSVESLRLSLAHSRALAQAGELAPALVELEATLNRWRALGISQQQDYAVALANFALLQRRLGNPEGAIAATREALALSRRIHPHAHEDTAGMLHILGQLLAERGDVAEAMPILDEASTMLESLLPSAHPLRIGVMGSLGFLEFEQQRYAQSEQVLQRSLELCRHAESPPGSRCATNEQWLSATLLRLGRVDEASTANSNALELRAALQGTENPDYAIMLRGRGDVRLAKDDPRAALADYDHALMLYAKAQVGDSLERAGALGGRARALLALARPKEALKAIEDAVRITSHLAPANRGRYLRLLATRASCLAALGRAADARATARSAIALETSKGVLDAGEWEQLRTLSR